MKWNFLNKDFFLLLVTFIIFSFCSAQTYRDIMGWNSKSNQKIEQFLNATLIVKERKVAVFDCDGTLLGQTPYYLADEALFAYAEKEFAQKNDSLSMAKMKVINKMLQADNVANSYLQLRIDFLSGLTTEAVEQIGNSCFYEKYQKKFFPEMMQLLVNLEDFGFEIWVLTASPELLYQQFIHENLGIPKNRILGVKSVVSNAMVTTKIIYPIPQEEGKAEAIQTFIKAKPLLVCGNSRGDLEMMNESVGMKIIINPDNKDVEQGDKAGAMKGYTLKNYWEQHDGVILYCNDILNASIPFSSKNLQVKVNTSNPKSDQSTN